MSEQRNIHIDEVLDLLERYHKQQYNNKKRFGVFVLAESDFSDEPVRSALMVGGMSEEKFLYGLAMALAVDAIENDKGNNIEVDRHESTTKR